MTALGQSCNWKTRKAASGPGPLVEAAHRLHNAGEGKRCQLWARKHRAKEKMRGSLASTLSAALLAPLP